MNYMIKVKCIVSDAIFELSGINQKLSSTLHIEGGRLKERYEEILEYLKKNSFINNEQLSYEHILSMFNVYVKKALINEAVQKVLNVESGEYDIRETLYDCITQGKIREYIYGEPMVRAFTRAIRELPQDDCMEKMSNGSLILLIEKKFLNDHHI